MRGRAGPIEVKTGEGMGTCRPGVWTVRCVDSDAAASPHASGHGFSLKLTGHPHALRPASTRTDPGRGLRKESAADTYHFPMAKVCPLCY